jgi:hypothetical protein
MAAMEPIFPGMDPYLEARGVWPDFHDAFLAYLREALQAALPHGYYAALRDREEVGIAGFGADTVYFPDVAVKKTARDVPYGSPSGGSIASATATLPERLMIASAAKVNFIEVRDAASGDRLVTVIELLSPSNKLPGPDREAFLRKQEEILASEANWVEIDLLRGGTRVACHASVDAHCRNRRYDYSVVVSRVSQRQPNWVVELYGFRLEDPLPAIAIPLAEPHPDVPLELGRVFDRTYTAGPYALIGKYDRPLDPPLEPERAQWARELIEARRRGGAGR